MPEEFDYLAALFGIGAIIWVIYAVGQNRGGEFKEEADEIAREIDHELDPDRKVELKLKWSKLANANAQIRRAFTNVIIESQGRDANERGHPFSANPYSYAQLRSRAQWNNGWKHMDQTIKWAETLTPKDDVRKAEKTREQPVYRMRRPVMRKPKMPRGPGYKQD